MGSRRVRGGWDWRAGECVAVMDASCVRTGARGWGEREGPAGAA